MAKTLAKMNLNGEFYFGKDLSIESNFLEEAEKILKREFNMDVGFYYGKKVMNFSVELNKIDLEISKKLMFNIDSILDVHFVQKKTLYEIGWCSSYMFEKRKIASERYLVEFSWLNISPNRKIYRKEVEKSTLVRFSLCECFNCELILQLTKWNKKNVG